MRIKQFYLRFSFFARKVLIFYSWLLLNLLLKRGNAKILLCDRVKSVNWEYSQGSFPTCWIDSSTTIDTSDYEFSGHDEQVKGLEIRRGTNVFFLPIRVNEAFRNLVAYSAIESRVKTLSRNNFRGLKDLKLLFLDGNHIKMIESDVFNDLTSLEILSLGL